MTENTLTKTQKENGIVKSMPEEPSKAELSVLEPVERFGFRLTHRMNKGAWKKFWTFFQRHIGSLWIYLATYNLMNVRGLKNFETADPQKPLILVSNHRSFFDMYTVASVIFRRTSRPITLFFPVRAKFFYDSPIGWLVNLVMGWWAMYPPFFREAKQADKREFDKFSLRKLIELSSTGKGNVIGFHPEGKRNLNEDPYSFLPAQPGVGKVIYESKPQVIPVFITGLNNDLPRQILGNWRDGEKVRIWFGEPIDLAQFFELRDSVRTHKAIADHLMEKIGELAKLDRKEFANEHEGSK